MARCEECLHYEVCAKEGRMVQVDEHTWDEYNKLDDVEQFCTNYFTEDVVPKSEVERLRFNLEAVLEEIPETKREVAREIFEEMQSCLIQRHWNGLDIVSFEFDAVKYAELKKKYTESEDKE